MQTQKDDFTREDLLAYVNLSEKYAEAIEARNWALALYLNDCRLVMLRHFGDSLSDHATEKYKSLTAEILRTVEQEYTGENAVSINAGDIRSFKQYYPQFFVESTREEKDEGEWFDKADGLTKRGYISAAREIYLHFAENPAYGRLTAFRARYSLAALYVNNGLTSEKEPLFRDETDRRFFESITK